MTDVNRFFARKKPWSKYKDLILDYYLKPYLAKVAHLRRPIAVVDCFAGPGKFDDGELGSPLLIAQHLSELHARSFPVQGIFIESDEKLFRRLETNLATVAAPFQAWQGKFQDHVTKLASLAVSHTVFLYVDPINPGDLRFDDLQSVYDRLHAGTSVETLINFLSFGFVRRARGLLPGVDERNTFCADDPGVRACNEIVGSTSWQEIILNKSLEHGDRIEGIANGYSKRLHKWFQYVLCHPIRKKYKHLPKYHLMFGSRSPHAVDLMNDAMVKARRNFVWAGFVDGFLFPMEPQKEIVSLRDVRSLLVKTARRIGRTTWRTLRVSTYDTSPPKYKVSELNRGIKDAIQRGDLACPAFKKGILESAEIWATNPEDHTDDNTDGASV